MASVPEHQAADVGEDRATQRVARLEKAVNIDPNLDKFVETEQNPDMRRMLLSTVGRIGRPPEKRKVSRQALSDFLTDQQQHERDCRQLPVVIFYFVFFAATVLSHEAIGDVSQVERNVRSLMEGTSFEGIHVSGHKSMQDIDTITDIWTFLKEAAVPWFIPDTATTLPRNVHRSMRYNQLIGGVQIQQIRRKSVLCKDESTLGPKINGSNPLLDHFMCYPWDDYSDQCFGGRTEEDPEHQKIGWCPDGFRTAPIEERRLSSVDYLEYLPGYRYISPRRLRDPSHSAKVRGGSASALSADANGGGFDGGIFSVTLHDYLGITAAVNKLQSLQNENWLDTASAWFGMKVFILNVDLAVFTHLVVNVYMPPSGELIPYVSLQSFPAEPYKSPITLVCDIIWAILWVHLLCVCVFGLVLATSKGNFIAYMENFWNLVDWATMLVGAVIIASWFVFLDHLSQVKSMCMEVALNRPTPGRIPPFASVYQEYDYLKDSDELHSKVAQLSDFMQLSRLIVCWYTILIMCRFFRAFKAQPKLAVVTNTIAKSMTDLAHFMVVLIVVVMSYAVAGMFMFGHRMLTFSELSITLNTCLLIMIGDFDFAEMGAEHPITSVLWFWTYMVLVSLIMLNMLLAIILDIYTEVKADAEDDDPIWTQFRRVLQESVSNRDFIKYNFIQRCIAELPPTVTSVDKDVLIDAVPDISEKQATVLLELVEKREQHEENKGMSISDAMKMVGWIKIAVQKVARRIEDIMQIELEEKTLLLSSGFNLGVTNGSAAPQGDGEIVSLDPTADLKLQALDGRLSQMEAFLKESTNFSVGRSREMRNRLAVIEDLLQANKDVLTGAQVAGAQPASVGRLADEWDIPPRLSSREPRDPGGQPGPPPTHTMNNMTVLFSA